MERLAHCSARASGFAKADPTVDISPTVPYANNHQDSFLSTMKVRHNCMADPRNAMDIRPGYRGRAFTSDLTGQEFWLVVDKGFQPLGMVIGNCIYSMGAMRNWLVGFKGNFKGELKEFSEVMYQARELALSRMQFEADQLGADGVIGVDIKIEYMHNNEWMEVTAVGTAVRYVGGGPNMPPTGHGRVTIPAG
jgi:uncharacterized protein YbjQ (UPF0145 family)